MQMRGRAWRDSAGQWTAECPALCYQTAPAASREEALGDISAWLLRAKPGVAFELREEGRGDFALAFAEPAKILALILQRRRARLGLTMAEVAEAMGLASRSQVAQAEDGKHELSLSRLSAILDALGVDIEISLVERPRPPARKTGS